MERTTSSVFVCICLWSVSTWGLRIPGGPPGGPVEEFRKQINTVNDSSQEVTVLMVGDSTMESQHKVALKYFSSKNVKINFVLWHYTSHWNLGGYPSYWTAERLLAKLGSPDRIDLAYLNFGALHLLHMHPQVPWWWTNGSNPEMLKAEPNYPDWPKGEHGWNGDYRGFLELERWMHEDIKTYREIAKNVVIATPNYVCDDVYRGKYYAWTHERKDEAIQLCTDYMKDREQKYDYWPKNNNVETQCQTGQLTADGSRNLRKRILTVAHELDVPVVDAFGITEKQCSHTRDARHYDEGLNQKMLDELALRGGAELFEFQ